MNSNSKTILAVLTGAFAGAALGVFFATRKGTETKDKVSKSVKNAVGAVGEKVRSAKETAAELKEKIHKASHNHDGSSHDKQKRKQQHV